MTKVAIALQSFWAGFGMPAFVEDSVPDEMPDENGVMHPVELPYITYRLAQPNWSRAMSMYARVWYHGTSYVDLSAKVDEISQTIGTGITIPYDSGFISLFKDDNFCQFMPEIDGTTKVAYLSLVMHCVEV